MAIYAIGDVQGCYDELMQLLEKIGFCETDQLWFCGDLVNRGPKSLETLRYVKGLGDRAVTVLGNHDLHLLAKAHGFGKALAKDTLDNILNAPDRDELLTWLRQQKLFHYDNNLDVALVHAGLPPEWDCEMALQCADELQQVLRGKDYLSYFEHMYGNKPKQWSAELTGIERLRFITNVFTRLRYCDVEGRLNLKDKGSPGTQKQGFMPWFEVPGRKSKPLRIVFGHWSTLRVGEYQNAIALDSGCLWGGKLTAVRLDSEVLQWFDISCGGACRPEGVAE